MSEKKGFKFKGLIIFLIIVCIIAGVIVAAYTTGMLDDLFNKEKEKISKKETKEQGQEVELDSENEYALSDNNLSKFDLSFLKFENEGENIIYSPLSIKYAFKMLEEATSGKSKKQIESIVGGYDLTEYSSNQNMALANAFFVNNLFKDSVNERYINLINNKYNASVVFDNFNSAQNVNAWVKDNTLGLIDGLFQDSDVEGLDFILLNSLGIDMDWNHKFLKYHYDDDENITDYVDYSHESIYWSTEEQLFKLKFNEDKDVSSMYVVATLNNYDIVNELGEDQIKETVKEEFIKWAKGPEAEYNVEFFENDFSDEGIEKAFEKYWAEGNEKYSREYQGKTDFGYIAEIDENYGKVNYSTDFSLYVDDDVKVFSKDLKEYDGTTLEYIGIMPITQDLDEFIEEKSEEDIKDLIGNLKELKLENFKDGVLTKITGYIPKFKFDYELNLQNDLEQLGVTDVFTQGKANLTELTDDKNVFIGKVEHKSNIEFTQDGIKAAAATGAGGLGAGGFFDYLFDIPTEEIDITFDKPYMFLIRDKATGETWFVGSVYEPLDASEEVGYISEIYNY